jgi:hypothetical protein
MNPALIARRALECSGVVGLYTLVERTHSYYKFTVDSEGGSREAQHAQNLVKFRKNIAEEAAEVLGRINGKFYEELEKIYKQSKSKDEITVWAKKLVGDAEIPGKLNKNAMKCNKKVSDQLRVIPVTEQKKCIQLSKHSERFKHNSEAAVKHLLNEFYDLENEAIIVFTTKQKQVSKIIESYRTKLFVNSPPKKYDEFVNFLQLMGCWGFVMAGQRLWPTTPATAAVTQATKAPRFRLLMCGALLVAAYVVSEDEKEVNDYDVAAAYDEAELPMPIISRLPIQQYGGIAPTVYRPLQNVDDRFCSAYTFDHVFGSLTDGIVFRSILFRSLVMYSSARSSHIFTAIAATVAASINDASEESYHTVTEDPHKKIFVADDALARNFSFSMNFKPLVLQALLFASGRWYLTVLVDTLMRLREVMKEAAMDDNFWVLFRSSDLYNIACRTVAFTDWISSPAVRLIEKVSGSSKYDVLIGDIIEKYYKSLRKRSEEEFLTTEEIVSLEKAMLYYSQTMHLPMKNLIPKPFDPNAPKTTSPHGPEESMMLQTISGVDNDSLARVHAFLEDSERSYIDKYFGGRVSLVDASAMVMQCITTKTWVDDESPRKMEESYVKRVLFWSDEATEENVLDLLQEYYEFLLAKRLVNAEDFKYVQGRAYMMDLECEVNITDDLMEDYYKQLDRWLQCAMELEEINFLNRYGLTKHYLESIVARRSSTQDLVATWTSYFNAKEYQEIIRKKADPVPVYRAPHA